MPFFDNIFNFIFWLNFFLYFLKNTYFFVIFFKKYLFVIFGHFLTALVIFFFLTDISGITDILPGLSPYWLSPIISFHHIGYPRYYRDIFVPITLLIYSVCWPIHYCDTYSVSDVDNDTESWQFYFLNAFIFTPGKFESETRLTKQEPGWEHRESDAHTKLSMFDARTRSRSLTWLVKHWLNSGQPAFNAPCLWKISHGPQNHESHSSPLFYFSY